MKRRIRHAVVWALGLACLAARPAPGSETVTYPFFGVTHTDRIEASPRPLRMHVVTIDLADPTISFLVTPQSGPRDTLIQTTRQFLTTYSAEIAVNAHFFTPFPDDGTGTTSLIGLAASSATFGAHGHAYAPFESNLGGAFQDQLPALNLGADNSVTIVYQAPGDLTGYVPDPAVTLWNAVSGNEQLLRNSLNVSGTTTFDFTLNPRTAIGIAPDNKLILFTVDGRQSGVSEGMLTGEVADLLLSDYGVTDAINLDGGGSTTLVFADPAPRVVNAPVGVNNVPHTERLVGSSLGVFAQACSAATEGAACGDDDLCNGDERCVSGICQPGAPPNCDDSNLCTDDVCVPATGCVHANRIGSCSDGLYCNGSETCAGGQCQPGTAVNCDDGIPCTTDDCNESLDACEHEACAVGVSAEGSRYLAVTPPVGLPAVALKVSAAGLACLPKYVDAAGGLTASPVFQSSTQWGTILVKARPIVPALLYTVTAEAMGGEPDRIRLRSTADWGTPTVRAT
jgi:hypothetical protein